MAKKTHKHQHYVPNSYLKAWHDTTQPLGPKRTPYLWRFDRDGSNPKRRAPENMFTENDIYTIAMPDGTRDLRLEHGFGGLEKKFADIRDHRLHGRQWPDANEMIHLLAFVALARVRTPAYRDAQAATWANIYKKMESFKKSFEAASPEQRKSMASFRPLGADQGKGLDMDSVALLRDHPIQMTVAPALEATLRMFARMHVAILCTDDPTGFVTSDNPCTWFDSEAYKRHPFYRAPGLTSKTIEVTMPLSPSQCLVISHAENIEGYFDVKPHAVGELNRRCIGHCNETFVARRNDAREEWFEERPEPDDSWEKTHPRPAAVSGGSAL